MRRYAKAIVAALVPILLAVQAALSDNAITQSEWVAILLAALGAVGVWAAPNRPPVGEPARPDISEQG